MQAYAKYFHAKHDILWHFRYLRFFTLSYFHFVLPVDGFTSAQDELRAKFRAKPHGSTSSSSMSVYTEDQFDPHSAGGPEEKRRQQKTRIYTASRSGGNHSL